MKLKHVFLSYCLIQSLHADDQLQDSKPKPSHHYGFYGDFLYWQAFVSDTTYAGLPSMQGVETNVHDYLMDFSWDPAFRIGLLFKSTYEDLIFDASWTRFYSTSQNSSEQLLLKNSAQSPNTGYVLYNNIYATTGSSINTLEGANWKVKAKYLVRFDEIDLSVKKESVRTKMYSLFPFFGLRGFILQQALNRKAINSYYGNSLSSGSLYDYTTGHKGNNMYSVGLLAGLKNHLNFGYGFGMHFDADVFIGYGKNKSYSSDSFSKASLITKTRLYQNSSGAKFMTDVKAGFDWRHSFYDDRLDFLFAASYEFHYLIQSPYFLNTNAYYHGDSSLSQNFGLQGLTLKAALDF
jgi:hypothetical protein